VGVTETDCGGSWRCLRAAWTGGASGRRDVGTRPCSTSGLVCLWHHNMDVQGDHARWLSRGWPRRCVRCGGRGRRGTKEEAASLSRVSLPPCPCFWRLCADEKGGNLAGAGTTLAGFYIQCAEGWQGMWHAETGCAPARHTHGRSRTGRDAGPRGTGCGARHGGSIGRFTGVCSQGLRPGSRVVVVCSGVWWWGVGRWCACCACTDATAVVGGSVRWCRAVHMQARPCACRPGLRSLSRWSSAQSLQKHGHGGNETRDRLAASSFVPDRRSVRTAAATHATAIVRDLHMIFRYVHIHDLPARPCA